MSRLVIIALALALALPGCFATSDPCRQEAGLFASLSVGSFLGAGQMFHEAGDPTDQGHSVRHDFEGAALIGAGVGFFALAIATGRAQASCRDRSTTVTPPATWNSPAPISPVEPVIPARLDSGMVAAAMANVKPAAMACAATAQTTGHVVVDVQVAASGSVVAVKVEQTPDAALGSCVAGAVWRATFTQTRFGGSFRYAFAF
jgi:hypothetical protein